MTDTAEPSAEGDSGTPAPSAQAVPETAAQRRSLWSRLDRTNRIAALVLGAVSAVFVAALIFGAGVLVGSEYGDSEGHHDGVGTSEYGDGDRASGHHEGDDEESAGDQELAGDSEGAGSGNDQGRRGEQGQSDGPAGQATGESKAPPRP